MSDKNGTLSDDDDDVMTVGSIEFDGLVNFPSLHSCGRPMSTIFKVAQDYI